MSDSKRNYTVLWEDDACEIRIAIETNSPKVEFFAILYYPALERAIDESMGDSDSDINAGDTLTIAEYEPRVSLDDACVFPRLFAQNMVKLLEDPRQTVPAIEGVATWCFAEETGADPGYSVYRPDNTGKVLFVRVSLEENDDDSEEASAASKRKLTKIGEVLPNLMRMMTYLDNFSSEKVIRREHTRPLLPQDPSRGTELEGLNPKPS